MVWAPESPIFEPSSLKLNGIYRYVQPQKVWFSAVLVINRVSIWPILVLIGYDFSTLVLNWVCFLEEATFSSLSIEPSTKALHLTYVLANCVSRNGHK